MNCSEDIVRQLQSCNRLAEFLESDTKTTNEMAFLLGEHGSVYEFREGKHSEVTVILPPSDKEVDERRVLVHTHPSIDMNVTPSKNDMDIGNHPAVCGMVVLVQEMFDVKWDGKAVYFPEEEETEPEIVEFRIECDGTTDGPSEDRWVENPRILLA